MSRRAPPLVRRRGPGAGPALSLGLMLLLGACAGAALDADAPVAVEAVPSLPPAPDLPVGVRLVGLAPQQVEGLLGRPELERHERAGQYWRYSYAGCTLDLFLYADPTAGKLGVAYYELRLEPIQHAGHSSRCQLARTRLGPAEGGELPEVATH